MTNFDSGTSKDAMGYRVIEVTNEVEKLLAVFDSAYDAAEYLRDVLRTSETPRMLYLKDRFNQELLGPSDLADFAA